MAIATTFLRAIVSSIAPTLAPSRPSMASTSARRSSDWQAGYNVARNYTVDGLNRYTSSGGLNLGYDGRGNLTSDGVTSFGYDVTNKLTSLSNGATLAYDALDRLAQTTGASITRFLYEGQQIIGEYDASGHVLRRYEPGPGIDQPLVWYEGSGTNDRRFLLADRQGSVIGITNGSGVLTAIDRYDEAGIPGAGNVGRFQWNAAPFLPEAGLYHMRARAYSPTLGRFMQTDPIGYGDGMNAYNYEHGDPVNRWDPSGTQDAATNPPADSAVQEVAVTGLRFCKSGSYDTGGTTNDSNGNKVRICRPYDTFGGHFGGISTGNGGGGLPPVGGAGQGTPENKNTKTCAGSARGLAGNTRLYGKMGAFSTVEPNTAAIIPFQFGGSRKADLRPYVGSISGRLTGVVGGRIVTSTFNSITDVIDGGSPIPGVPVRDALQQLFTGQLIVEVTGGADVGSNASVVLNNYPASLPCPTGTTAQ